MTNLKNSGAAVRNSFINEFVFGDKSKAIQDLIKRAHESCRFDGIISDDFIYEGIARTQANARRTHISQAGIPA